VSEIILVMGPLAAGKTTLTQFYVSQGYVRLNRDLMGGSASKANNLMHQALREQFARGERNFVMDNTYGNKASRTAIIALGAELGLPVLAYWLQTTAAQAQFLASLRQVRKYGKILEPHEYKMDPYKKDPGCFPPLAQYAYWKRMEPPTVEEGFAGVVEVPFKLDLGHEYSNTGVIFDYDGTLRETISGDFYPKEPSDVRLLPSRRRKLQTLKAQGVRLLGASNQSGIARKPGDPKYVSEADAIASFERTNELLGVNIDYQYASERAGAPRSFQRKPMPGMGVAFVEAYKLNPAQVLMVGDMKSDRTFAERCGFQFQLADDYFGD
jgi:HAD superfamily hydrolase (TIGR01662 family)